MVSVLVTASSGSKYEPCPLQGHCVVLGKTITSDSLTQPSCLMSTGKFECRGINPAMDYHPIKGEVEILLVALCYGNQDKLRPNGPPGSYLIFVIQKDQLPHGTVNSSKVVNSINSVPN